MYKEKFVQIIKQVVVDESIKGVISSLNAPFGRSPRESDVLLSKWYNSLSDAGKSCLLQVVKESVDSSVFGIFCVLDGVKAIEANDKGILKLYYENKSSMILLNDPKDDYLHDIFLSL